MCYEAVKCLNIPRALFEDERYCNLSNNAKILYSLFLERLKYALMNKWVDTFGFAYIHYPKSEIMKDLRCSRYAADAAVNELKNEYGLICITCPCNGKANRIYVKDITRDIVENDIRGENDMNKMKKDMTNAAEENMEEELLEKTADLEYQRIYSRLFEMCIPVICSGTDIREKEGQEKFQYILKK